MATSTCPLNKAITEAPAKANTPVEAASPSRPSVRLYAFEAPVITKIANNGYNHFRLITYEQTVRCVPCE